MNECELKSGSNEDGKTQTDWNVNAIVEQVFGDLTWYCHSLNHTRSTQGCCP